MLIFTYKGKTMCAGSTLKGIHDQLRLDVISCINKVWSEKFSTGELVTHFTLHNDDIFWGGVTEVEVVKIDFENQSLILNIAGDKEDEWCYNHTYNDAPLLTLIKILEHIQQII